MFIAILLSMVLLFPFLMSCFYLFSYDWHFLRVHFLHGILMLNLAICMRVCMMENVSFD